ncbi:hypothetical protein O3P69_013757 [Scylla paramamosain]|uniref:Uncharacterized protein n=1 Tax=Scylla paramamosain TaxID=85552 RepID=A0AAW0SQD1_SCYPA
MLGISTCTVRTALFAGSGNEEGSQVTNEGEPAGEEAQEGRNDGRRYWDRYTGHRYVGQWVSRCLGCDNPALNLDARGVKAWIVKYSTGLAPHLKPPDPREVALMCSGGVERWSGSG